MDARQGFAIFPDDMEAKTPTTIYSSMAEDARIRHTRRSFLRHLVGGLLLAPYLPYSLAEYIDDMSFEEFVTFILDEADGLGVNTGDTLKVLGKKMDLPAEIKQRKTWVPRLSMLPKATQRDWLEAIKNEKLLWWDKERKETPEWPPIEHAIDYFHLQKYQRPNSAFSLKANHLEWLLRQNHFQIPDSQEKVIFGLRGCVIPEGADISAAGEWRDSCDLEWVFPNHMDPLCILGVWDRSNGMLCVFPGSTVPEVTYMYLYVYGMLGCNLLPTGMYRYTVGTHRAQSGNPQSGALRQADNEVVVLRSASDLMYNSTQEFELWQKGMPWDNIHAAHSRANDRPSFFSAGCQVVVGSQNGPTVRGPWSRFRKACGLTHPPDPSDNGREFRYVLLTGLEAALVASDSTYSTQFYQTYRCARFGSSGSEIRHVQRDILDVNADGDFRARSVLALIAKRQDQGEFETGIYSF